MSKQTLKRHKREVARAKMNIKLSEPDVRTPEQIKAAREASRPADGGTKLGLRGSAPSQPGRRPMGTGGAAKTDA